MEILSDLLPTFRKLLPGLAVVLVAYKVGDWWADETGSVPAFLPLLATLLYLHLLGVI